MCKYIASMYPLELITATSPKDLWVHFNYTLAEQNVLYMSKAPFQPSECHLVIANLTGIAWGCVCESLHQGHLETLDHPAGYMGIRWP